MFFFTVNGGYGEWGEFGECTVTCGGGVWHRTRKCNKPATVLPGKTCEEQGLGPNEEMAPCNVESCPGEEDISDCFSLIRYCLVSILL